jgi:hypothetical protein
LKQRLARISQIIKAGIMKEELLYSDLTYKIIGFAMKVHTTLGSGFLEKVYENSLIILLRRAGIKA